MSLQTRETSPANLDKTASRKDQDDGRESSVLSGRRRENLTLTSTLIVGLTLACLVLVLLLLKSNRLGREQAANELQCQLLDESKTRHILEQQDQIRVPSDDFRTLVKFAGALQYLDLATDDANLLPLKLRSISVESSGAPNGERALVLWTNCGRLSLQLASDGKQLLVGSIDLETKRVRDRPSACQVSTTSIALANFTQSRYSSRCDEQIAQQVAAPAPAGNMYDCKWTHWLEGGASFVQETIARLYIHSLEFELDGRQALIRQNRFSKPSVCSGR